MADIFFSYAKVDRDRVQPLIESLEAEWTVWWDDDLTVGRSWGDEIEAELNKAHCAIVAWTHSSIKSAFVQDEARHAYAADKLVPVMLDPVKLPMGLGGVQAANFSKWNGKPDAVEFIRLRDAIRRRLNNALEPTPADVVPTTADKPETSPADQTPPPPNIETPVSKKWRLGPKTWIIAVAIAIFTGAGGNLVYDLLVARLSQSTETPAAPAAANGYTVYLHTKRPQPQIDALTQRLKQAGYDVASSDKDADNDSGKASPRTGVDYATANDAAKNSGAADKAARIANELLGTDLKPRPQSAMAAGKLGIWLPYMGDYNVTIHFAGVFNRKDEIIPFAEKLRDSGWSVQEPAAGGGERDETAANLCEVRYRTNDDRAFAELLAIEVPKAGLAPGRPSVKLDSSKVKPGELQLWIGSGICK